LGRLLAEDPEGAPESRQVLRAAVASGNARVEALAAHLLTLLDEGSRVERFAPPADMNLRCMTAATQGAFHLCEFLPRPQSFDDWTEIVTVTAILGPSAPSPRDRMESSRGDIETRLIDGHLEWEVIAESPSELIYESTVEGDGAALDQTEIVRSLRTESGLHTIQHAIRGEVARARAAREERLSTLRGASVALRDPPTVEP